MLPHINIFGLSISTYYSMMFAGFIFMMILMIKRRRRFRLGIPGAVIYTILIMFSGVLGCKVLYILENLDEVRESGISLGGFSFFGAVFLVAPLMALFGLLFRLKPKESLDASAPCVCAMVGTIRVGCFLNGCCGGWTTSSGFTWPTQAIESICDFLILFWLLRSEEKGKGDLYPKFALSYSVIRFFIEFFRDTPKDWLSLSDGQWFSIAAALISLSYFVVKKARSKA